PTFATFMAAAAAQQAYEAEFRIVRSDGVITWVADHGTVRLDAEGRFEGFTFYGWDITERKAAQQALAAAKDEAERLSRAKSEFLSRMSHELRTPLNAVLGFAQLMTLDHADPLSEAQRARVGHIQGAGWHLLALVNDVLDLAKIESRQAQLVFSRVPLAEVVHECLAMSAPLAHAKGVRQHWLQDPGTPDHVWADRTRLKQLLLNLVSNAVKYNRSDGLVQVAASVLPTGEVQISVSDTGLGLSEAQLARLFEPFNRLGRETSGIEGTGIGLALCKLIAEQMGGHIGADSQPGQGCVFRVTLPGVATG
ncbi:MAG: sensor histidine kinase, partial [Rubrivivax sp.]